jgi:tetratricopeptide (TPR) repeat protein
MNEADRAKQIEHLDKAIAEDPADADVLIALYRLSSDDPNRRKRTLELIEDAAVQFRNEVADAPEDPTAYNQFAWLVGNTEGDLDTAIHYSHRSIELLEPLRKPAGYLDTLAHCYAAKGDLESAIKYQTRAVEIEPHTQQIRRALERFIAEKGKQ